MKRKIYNEEEKEEKLIMTVMTNMKTIISKSITINFG